MTNPSQNIQIAKDTLALFPKMQAGLMPSQSTLINKVLDSSQPIREFTTRISVENESTIARLIKLNQSKTVHDKIGLMNFASATDPGGGFLYGANAQEEALCRASFLYFELNTFTDTFYKTNRKNPNGALFTNQSIYSRNVTFIKDDTGKRLPEPIYTDVISVAAPNSTALKSRSISNGFLMDNANSNQNQHVSDQQIKDALQIRILNTLRAFKKNRVDLLILGAFGCGAFGNDPKLIARIFKDNLEKPDLKRAFKEIYFSVYDRPNGPNYSIFKQTFAE